MGDNADAKLNPWHPIKDAVDLKHLGKLGEELGECSAAVSRCIIQGIDEVEPTTGKLNRHWLEDELADVCANSLLVIERFRLDRDRRARRQEDGRVAHLARDGMSAVIDLIPNGDGVYSDAVTSGPPLRYAGFGAAVALLSDRAPSKHPWLTPGLIDVERAITERQGDAEAVWRDSL